MLGELLLNAVDICLFLVDLIDRNDHFHFGCFGMVNSLNGLRHHAVVRRYYQDSDISRIGAAHTHGSERLMTRRIEESDRLFPDFHN